MNAPGMLRGIDVLSGAPYFQDELKAELWLGESGTGKTFYSHLLLSDLYVAGNIQFDLIESFGSGQALADRLNVPYIDLRTAVLNPLDVMFTSDIIRQIKHVQRLYETLLGHRLPVNERLVLHIALYDVYDDQPIDWRQLTVEQSPRRKDLLRVLDRQGVAGQSLAAELRLLPEDAPTSVDLLAGATGSRIWGVGTQPFVYMQVLAAVRRGLDSASERRMLLMDDISGLLQMPAALEFLVESVRRVGRQGHGLVCIEQACAPFSSHPARFILDQAAVRMLFRSADQWPELVLDSLPMGHFFFMADGQPARKLSYVVGC